MSLKIRIKILAVIVLSAITIVAIYFLNDSGSLALSENFFRGLVIGLTSTALVVWIVSTLVILQRKRKTDQPEKIEAYNRQLTAGIGWICLLTGIFLTRMEGAGEIVYIISSVFFIVSIVLMTSYLTKMKKHRSEDAAV